jgi:hypothetical protein
MQYATRSKSLYDQYVRLGGIINEVDYQSIFERAKNTTRINISLIKQSELIAQAAGIELLNTKNTVAPITMLYGILRTDTNSESQYHHSQMCDQRLFAEALRILADEESLNKLIIAYPNISFD